MIDHANIAALHGVLQLMDIGAVELLKRKTIKTGRHADIGCYNLDIAILLPQRWHQFGADLSQRTGDENVWHSNPKPYVAITRA